MPLLGSPRFRRIFIQAQTGGFGSINNTGGTWNNAGATFLPAMENAVVLNPNMPRTPVPILTGTRSYRTSILGRKTAIVELNNVPIIPSGTAGTAPQTDLLWQNIFGQAPTVSAGVSVTYNFLDTGFIPLTILDFMHSAPTLQSRLVWGSFFEEFTLTYNGNIFTGGFRGFGGYRLDSTNFSNEDSTAAGGLTTYPTEPGSAVSVLGTVIPGFYATCSIHSQAVETKVRTLELRCTTGFRMIADVISSAYGVAVVGGPRRAQLRVGLILDDSAQFADLEVQSKQNNPVTATITLGQVGGSKVQIVGQGLQLIPSQQRDENSDIIMADYGEADFHASAVGNTDDIQMVFL